MDAWQGPEGGDQDFLFSDTWTEVKTVALASQTLKISSLEQLDQDTKGFIKVFILEKGQNNDENYNLPKVVAQIHDTLLPLPFLRDRFDMKLFKTGYREEEEDMYKNNNFRLIESRTYYVDEQFPKLTHKNVRPEIVFASYELSLSALDSYRR